MALRLCAGRAGVAARSATKSCRTVQRRAATTATQESNLPNNLQAAIRNEATKPTPDPASDSQTARLTSSTAPYMVPTYIRPPPIFVKGLGSHLYDIENRQYLDFTAGIAVNALGHSDPDIAAILHNQASTLVHSSNLYHNPWTGALSKSLVEKTKESGAMRAAARAFICNSGSEANEAAIKFCRKFGSASDSSKTHLLSFHGSFHGRTMGALSATPNPKYQKPFAPMLPGFSYGNFNDVEALRDSITEKTCGVLVEPIQGEGGVNVATRDFLAALRKRCDEVGALLVFDEIQCGLGRTGDLWAHAKSDVHPDVLTTAKALGNGFPIGACMVTERVSSAIVTGDHGTTFGGNPLGCRVAHHILSRLSDPELLSGVHVKESVFREAFEGLRQRWPGKVGETRGRGLILGLQLAADPTKVVTAARERGLLVITCGTNTLRFVPPLIISEEEIAEGMRILESAMEAVWDEDGEVQGTKGQQEMGDKGRESMRTSATG